MKLHLESPRPSDNSRSDSHSGKVSPSSVQHLTSTKQATDMDDGEEIYGQEEYGDGKTKAVAVNETSLPASNLEDEEIEWDDVGTIWPTPQPSVSSVHTPKEMGHIDSHSTAKQQLIAGEATEVTDSKMDGKECIGGTEEDKDNDHEAAADDFVSLDSTLTSVPTIGKEYTVFPDGLLVNFEDNNDGLLDTQPESPPQTIETNTDRVPDNEHLQVSTDLDSNQDDTKYKDPAGGASAPNTLTKADTQFSPPVKSLRKFWEGRTGNKNCASSLSGDANADSPEEAAAEKPTKESTAVPKSKDCPSCLKTTRLWYAVMLPFALIIVALTCAYIFQHDVEVIQDNSIETQDEHMLHQTSPEEKEDNDLHCFSTDMTSFASMAQWEFDLSQDPIGEELINLHCFSTDMTSFASMAQWEFDLSQDSIGEKLISELRSGDSGASPRLYAFAALSAMILLFCSVFSKPKNLLASRVGLHELNKKLQDLENENGRLKETLNSAETKNATLEQDAITLKTGNIASSAGRATLEKEKSELSNLLQELEEEKDRMKEQMKFTEHRNASLHQDMTRLQERVDYVEIRNATLEQDVESQRKQGDGLVVPRIFGPVGSIKYDATVRLLEFRDGSFSTAVLDEIAVTEGVLYYEVEMLEKQAGQICAQFGFSLRGGIEKMNGATGFGVGDNAASWGICGFRKELWHDQKKVPIDDSSSTCSWEMGDMIGFAVNVGTGMIAISKNGNWSKEAGCGVVFENVSLAEAGSDGDSIHPGFSCRGLKVLLNVQEKDFHFSKPPAGVWQGWY